MRKIELYEITPEELVEMIINGLKDSNFNGVEKGTFSSSQILDITGAMNFLGMTRSAIYKKTSSRLIPHYKKGKKIYFDKNELIDWVKESKVSTMAEIERKANSYVLKRRR